MTDEFEVPVNGSSSNVKAWYRGYSVLIHLTGNATPEEYIKYAEDTVNELTQRKGWKEVWDTNKPEETKPVSNFQSGSERMVAKANVDKSMQENCPHTLFTIKVSHSTNNPGKQFKSCNACGKFLGWTSQPETGSVDPELGF